MPPNLGDVLDRLDRNQRETNAWLRQMGAAPKPVIPVQTPYPASVPGDNRGMSFYEAGRAMVARYDKKFGLGVRAGTIELVKQIAAAATTGGSSDAYGIGNDEDFLCHTIRGFLTFDDWTAEVALAAILGTNVSPRDRAYVKASNAVIRLTNEDIKASKYIGNIVDIPLASFLCELGAPPLKYGSAERPALIIPHDTNPKMTVTLKSYNAAIVGGTSTYGVIFEGVWVPRGG